MNDSQFYKQSDSWTPACEIPIDQSQTTLTQKFSAFRPRSAFLGKPSPHFIQLPHVQSLLSSPKQVHLHESKEKNSFALNSNSRILTFNNEVRTERKSESKKRCWHF